eukprot:SAG31_NODE_1903_length_6956_cov_3.288902_7_plen_59_part_00
MLLKAANLFSPVTLHKVKARLPALTSFNSTADHTLGYAKAVGPLSWPTQLAHSEVSTE